jgi:methylase of polypeptide subunit release factors
MLRIPVSALSAQRTPSSEPQAAPGPARESRPSISTSEKETARRTVLETLGIDQLVSTAFLDIAEGHRQHVVLQRTPARFLIDGLTIEAPGGVYHPTPESSSLLFIRNIMAMNKPRIPRMLEIGTGCGAISLFVAHRWKSEVLATDIADEAIASARANSEANGIPIRLIKSDLFDNVDERDFDLVVFNVPLIDKEPEDDLERANLCDPGGRILRRFVEKVGRYIGRDGVAIFSVCSNTAYEALDGIDLSFRIVGLELVGDGFWRAIVGARHL